MKTDTRIYEHPHPGRIVKNLMERNNLSVGELAEKLKVTRVTTSKLINCRLSISSEMAVRLTALFGGSIRLWANLQANYEAWLAEKTSKAIFKQIMRLKKTNRNLEHRAAS